MRLLTTAEPWKFVETLEPPPYAILSHTWMTTNWGESQEVTYQELQAYMKDPETNTITASKPGFLKIRGAIDYAIHEGHTHIWIDTCCIDKTNQLELDEAIRCMFKWYQDATVCYAYLSDVVTQSQSESHMGGVHPDFKSSRWFTRGWTLQELVAPRDVVFLARDWSYLGHRLSKGQFGRALCEASGISEAVLYGIFGMSETSISERMRWAAHRKTTRIEDMAYSLMGIFNVHMPIMYGEGKDAFIRLQKNILQDSDDHSIFAWTSPHGNHDQISGLLADSPECFADIKNLQQSYSTDAGEWQYTNKGLRLQLVLYPCEEDSNADYFAHLDCYWHENGLVKRPKLRLRYLGGDQYARVHISRLFWRESDEDVGSSQRKTLFVKQAPLYPRPDLIVAPQHISDSLSDSILALRLHEVYPEAYWDGERFNNTKYHSTQARPALFRFVRKCDPEYYVDVAVGFSNEGPGKWKPWYTQRRCRDSREDLSVLYQIVCREMESNQAGPVKMPPLSPDNDAAFRWHVHTNVTISASLFTRSSAEALSYTIELESPKEICSQPLSSIQAKHGMSDSCEFVPSTISADIYEEINKNMCELLRPRRNSHLVWRRYYAHFDTGPRDYSFSQQFFGILDADDDVRGSRNLLVQNYDRVKKTLSEFKHRIDLGKPSFGTTPTFYGLTPLHRAAFCGNLETVESLLQAGVDAKMPSQKGWSACHIATIMGHGAVVERFLDHDLELAKLSFNSLVKGGPCSKNRYESIFHIAARLPSLPEPNFLLTRSFWAKYGDLEGPLDASRADEEGFKTRNFLGKTPLHQAAATGNLRVATILVNIYGSAIVNTTDMDQQTPLWHAAAAGYHNVVNLLLTTEPEPGRVLKEDAFGINALHIACWNNRPDVAHALLSHTKSPNTRSSKFGFTPAHFAYYGNSFECIKELEDFGADMDIRSTPEWFSTSPKDVKAFVKTALRFNESWVKPGIHMKNFTSVSETGIQRYFRLVSM